MKRYLPITAMLTIALAFAIGMISLVAASTPVEYGYRDFQFGASCSSTPTGEKPESKLWWNDGFWWGSLCTPDVSGANDGYHIYRFDVATQDWVDTGTKIDPRNSSKADALWDGQKLYVASHTFSTSGSATSESQRGRLYRYSYNSTTKTYTLDAGFPVIITGGKSETLVLEKTPSGQLWVTYVESNQVMVNHSTTNDLTWGTPFVLPIAGATGLYADDISSLISFDHGTASPKVGVLWSNQIDHRMYFAIHVDGAADNVWNSFHIYAAGPLAADDHINLKLQSDGQGVYAVIKTSNEGTDPLVVLLSCLSSCSSLSNWRATPVHSAATGQTRAIVLIDTDHRKINVITTAPETGGAIYRAIFNMDTLSATSTYESFGLFIRNQPTDIKLNNATSTKQTVNSTTGLLVLASEQDTSYYLHNFDPLGGAIPSTPTPTQTSTATQTPTVTQTPTATRTPTATSQAPTMTPTRTSTATPTSTATAKPTQTSTPTQTATPKPGHQGEPSKVYLSMIRS